MRIKNRPNILIFQRVITDYRESIFQELCNKMNVIICFGKNGPPGSFLKKKIPAYKHCRITDYYPCANNEYLLFQNIFYPLLKYKPGVIVIEFALGIISNLMLFILRPFFKFKLILWTHGYNRKREFDPARHLSDKLRIWLLNRADAIITYSQHGSSVLKKFINRPEKVFVVPNTLDTRKLVLIRDELELMGKEKIKNEIGFKEAYNITFIGRLLKDKEPDRLIEVFKIISKELDSAALHIVGDGPYIKEIKNLSKGLRVKFWGYVTDDYEAGKLLFASDLVVIPGYVGLSVVHSFCFDKPVVTQKRGVNGPFHSPEIEYLIDGQTGFMVNYDDNQELAKTVINYLTNKEIQGIMKDKIRITIETLCNINNMLNGFKKAVDYVI